MPLDSRHLLGIETLTAGEIDLILDTAESFVEVGRREIKKVPTLRGRTVVNFFVEPSTRTRTSFELAEKRLSADIINFGQHLEFHQGRDAARHGQESRGPHAGLHRDPTQRGGLAALPRQALPVVILPTFESSIITDGITVANPEVGLILPVAPDFGTLPPGLTLAQPVVILRLDVPPGVGAASLPGLVLRLVEVESTAPIESLNATNSLRGTMSVVLEWMGPAHGDYAVEASSDLHTWNPVRMEILSTQGGLIRARCEVVTPEATFYRLRHTLPNILN